MNWVKMIQDTIDYIEDNLSEELDISMLASRIYTSQFYFQKMFALLCDISISEYIRNRRMTEAGYEVIDLTTSIIDIAINYGYDTNESFTRAFTKFHGIAPSKARKDHANLNAFSRITLINNLLGGKKLMSDFSERGYVVKENGAVYFTNNMDQTLTWFKDVLGWYGQIELRDEDNNGTYG